MTVGFVMAPGKLYSTCRLGHDPTYNAINSLSPKYLIRNFFYSLNVTS